VNDKPPHDQGGRRFDAGYLKYAGVGLQFSLTFLVFGAVGWWLDQKLDSSPWLMIGGILFGAAGAMYSLVRRLAPAPKDDSGRPADRDRP
jgi:F0F1-type ATP synthase assembly protein I